MGAWHDKIAACCIFGHRVWSRNGLEAMVRRYRVDRSFAGGLASADVERGYNRKRLNACEARHEQKDRIEMRMRSGEQSAASSVAEEAATRARPGGDRPASTKSTWSCLHLVRIA